MYLRAQVYRAVKIKAATADRPISELVNEALVQMLREDAIDLEAFDDRAKQDARPFEAVLKSLKRDGFL